MKFQTFVMLERNCSTELQKTFKLEVAKAYYSGLRKQALGNTRINNELLSSQALAENV